MSISRVQLTRVENWDGNRKRPVASQLNSTDTTTSQAFYTNQYTVTTASTPRQLPNKNINPGFKVLVRAKASNTVSIHLGANSTASQWTGSQAYVLTTSEAIELPISNLNLLYINSSISGAGVDVIIV